MFFHNPLGLLALLGIPILIWLHKFVLAGERRDVSNIALWQDTERLKTEGVVRRKLPKTLVLLLEILALLALSLAIAGLDVRSESAYRHIGVVVDSSASMTGGARPPKDAWLDRLEELAAPDVRFSVVESGKRPNLLGGKPLSYTELQTHASTITHQQPFHSMVPSMELLSMAGVRPLHQLVISDREDVQHGRLLVTGDPVPNFGIVSAYWQVGDAPFFVIRRFASAQKINATLVSFDSIAALQANAAPTEGGTGGVVAENVLLDLTKAEEVPLNLPVSDQTVAVTLVLQSDDHQIDNQVTLIRPAKRAVSMRVLHDNINVQRAARRLQNVLPNVVATEKPTADITLMDTPYELARGMGLAIYAAGKEPQLQTRLVLDAFHPLLAGVDVGGLVWYAPVPPAGITQGGRVLLSSQTGVPLLWQRQNVLIMNVDLKRSNVLQHSLFPIVLQNLVELRNQQKGGLLRNNFRLGDSLTLQARPSWVGNPVMLTTPDKQQHVLDNLDGRLPIGDLEQLGIYTLSVTGNQQHFAVNLLDPEEGELRYRTEHAPMPEMIFGALEQRSEYSWIRWILILLAIIFLLLAWLLLRRAR